MSEIEGTTNYNNRCCCSTIIGQANLLSSKQNTMWHRARFTRWLRRLVLMGLCFLFLRGLSWMRLARAAESSSIATSSPSSFISGDIASTGISSVRSSRLLVKSPQGDARHHWKNNSHRHNHNRQLKNFAPNEQNESPALPDYYLARGGQDRLESNKIAQVPEQMPIVVSSSDNSYVSASPVIVVDQLDQTTSTPFVADGAANNRRQRSGIAIGAHQQHSSQSRSRRLFANHISQNDDDKSNEVKRWSLHRHPLFRSSSSRSSGHRGSNKSDARTVSAGDISTTATTTPRISQMAALSEHQPTESLISRFEIKLATIINTQESIVAGATFINHTVVTNFDACLVECWITDYCDTAVYQDQPVAFQSNSPVSSHVEHNSIRHHENLHSQRRHNRLPDVSGGNYLDSSNYHICFLFECMKSNELRCQFSAHNNYISSILMKKTTVATEGSLEEEAEQRSNDKSDVVTVAVDDEDRNTSRLDCDQDLEFKCLLNDAKLACIELARRCDGIVDCLDESDESNCPDESGTMNNQGWLKSVSNSQVINNKVHGDDDDDDDDVNAENDNSEDETSISLLDHVHKYIPNDLEQDASNSNTRRVIKPRSNVHYSRIVDGHHRYPGDELELKRRWHDTHIASIRIGEYEEYGKGGLNSALIAILFGVAITAMLIMVVGHKMRSIRRRLAYKNRRRSLVPDKEILISSMPVQS